MFRKVTELKDTPVTTPSLREIQEAIQFIIECLHGEKAAHFNMNRQLDKIE